MYTDHLTVRRRHYIAKAVLCTAVSAFGCGLLASRQATLIPIHVPGSGARPGQEITPITIANAQYPGCLFHAESAEETSLHPRPADVMVYVSGEDWLPIPAEVWTRDNVNSTGSSSATAAVPLAPAHSPQTGEFQNLILQGSSLKHAGRFAEAATVYQEAVRLAGQTGQDATRVAWTRAALAAVYDDLCRFAEAEREYRHSLALYEHAGAQGTAEFALVVASLACHYVDLGRMTEAEMLLHKSIAILSSVVRFSLRLFCPNFPILPRYGREKRK